MAELYRLVAWVAARVPDLLSEEGVDRRAWGEEVEAMVETFERKQDQIEVDGRGYAGAAVLGDALSRLRRLQAVNVGGGDGG